MSDMIGDANAHRERIVRRLFPFEGAPLSLLWRFNPGENEESQPATPVRAVYRMIPSAGRLRLPPFHLSDPADYVSMLQELDGTGSSSPSGLIAEIISNYTFLLRITPPNDSGELTIELMAVFEGDVLRLLSP